MIRHANPKKSAKVKSIRGHSPEDVATYGELLDVLKNQKYAGQELEIYWFENYVWVVVVGKNPDRFITAYKSRKLKKRYGK
ncbi:MAG: hypothetical protein HY537_14885 [Deltaproteobacteria bacterium]|nr:hypothetical protein [Deltaproteobacteria bacterium]